MQGGFQALDGVEAVGPQHLGDPAVEALHQAVGLEMVGAEAVFDVLFGAGQVEAVGP
ncbi:hypothetical protein [Candidatus Methylocalor cossyra]|uniref:hypothetical protein n=1 Tax=Candidatus Methylocalor cossyra TaxID=3108543 RepID=UPI0032B214B0